METWLTTLLNDLATRDGIGTVDRHDLLVDVLAPLGPVDADAYAADIAEHGYWVRHSTHQTGADYRLAAAVSAAVLQVQNTFTPGLQAAA